MARNLDVEAGLNRTHAAYNPMERVMTMNWSNKTGVSSAAAAVVAVLVVAWPVASHAERGHGHSGGSQVGGGFSAGHSSSGGHAMGGVRSFSGDRGSHGGGRSFGFRTSDGHRHFRHRHNGVAFGFYGDDYGYGYTSNCEYYRQRALDTGRSYWWRRYRDCIEY